MRAASKSRRIPGNDLLPAASSPSTSSSPTDSGRGATTDGASLSFDSASASSAASSSSGDGGSRKSSANSSANSRKSSDEPRLKPSKEALDAIAAYEAFALEYLARASANVNNCGDSHEISEKSSSDVNSAAATVLPGAAIAVEKA